MITAPRGKKPLTIEDLEPVAGESQIRMVPLSAMRPAAYNPRRITPEAERALEASLDQFGNVGVVVWNIRSGNIVGGHQRFRIAKRKKMKRIETRVVDVDDATERAMNVALNSATAQGEWDRPKLEEILGTIRPDFFDALGLGALRADFTPPERTVTFAARDYKQTFQVVVECRDEKEQRKIHDQLVKLGLNVKVAQL